MAFAHVQGSFRDSFPSSFPHIPGALESSQRAALVGDTSIRTAGIVEPSVSQKVDGGPEEGHGHGIYVIIVLIDSCLCDIISTEIRCKIDANFFSRNRIRFRAFPTKPGVSRLARGRFFRARPQCAPLHIDYRRSSTVRRRVRCWARLRWVHGQLDPRPAAVWCHLEWIQP